MPRWGSPLVSVSQKGAAAAAAGLHVGDAALAWVLAKSAEHGPHGPGVQPKPRGADASQGGPTKRLHPTRCSGAVGRSGSLVLGDIPQLRHGQVYL